MFGKLASLFVEVEGKPTNGQKPPEKPEAEAEPAAMPTSAAAVSPPAPTAVQQPVMAQQPTLPVNVSVQVDPEMAQILEQALIEGNLEGYDYLEFRQALAGMASIPLTEQQKFQACFASAQTMNVTKQQLVAAVDHYLGILQSKASEFDSFVQELTSREVTAREQKIALIDEANQADAAKIEELTRAIQERQQQQQLLAQEVGQERVNIQGKQSAFEVTMKTITDRLVSDKQKLDAYLQEPAS